VDSIAGDLEEIRNEVEAELEPEGVYRLEENDESGREPWTPGDERAVDWALMKRARALERVNALEQEAAEQIRILEAAFGRRIQEAERDLEFFTDAVKRAVWTLAEEDKKGGRKLARPLATIYTRRTEAIEVDDPEAVIEWAREEGHYEDLVRIKESVDRANLKSWIHETGEIPPKCRVEEQVSVVIREV
jgi:hypothetical protein